MESDSEFDQKARERFRRLASSVGPCPDAATLDSYATGRLASEQAEAVRRHVVLCGECDLILARWQNFEVPTEPSTGVLRRLFLGPAVAWACVCLLVVPAYWGLRGRVTAPGDAKAPPVAPVAGERPAIRSLSYLDLDRTRGSAARGREVAGPVVLSFTVPSAPGATYVAVLRSHGQEIRTQVHAWNGLGGYYLLVEDPSLFTNACHVAIEETDKSGRVREAGTFDCSP